MKTSRRRTFARRFPVNSVQQLEKRALLAAVVDWIQIDNQAPARLGEISGSTLLALSDEDSTRLFVTEGTQVTTVELVDIPVTDLKDVQVVGGNLFFTGQNGQQRDLYRTNSEPGGTILVKEDVYSSGGSVSYAVLNDELFFAANGDNPLVGIELFKSDGGPAVLVRDLAPGVRPEVLSLQPDRGAHFEIWVNELDPETRQVVRSRVINETNIPAAATYSADLPDGYYRYWIRPTDSQGNQGDWSEPLDRFVFQATFHGAPDELTVYQNEIYFSANTEEWREVWKSDGTESGTVRVDPFDPTDLSGAQSGKQSPRDFVEFDGYLFFGSNDGLSRTDGNTVQPVELGMDRNIFPVAVANGHLFSVDTSRTSGQDTFGVFSLSAADDSSPEEIHRIANYTGIAHAVHTNRLDSFAVVNDRLAFQSVLHVATHSYNLSPSDDRLLPSSHPRNWLEKNGSWILSDGTAAGTNTLPGHAFHYREDDTRQTSGNFKLQDSYSFGNTWIIDARDTWQLAGNDINRVAWGGDPAIMGDELLAPSNEQFLMSVTASGIREENLQFENLTSVEKIRDAFWASAALGEGSALFKIDLASESQAGPVVSGLDSVYQEGFGDIVIRPEGRLQFTWQAQQQISSYDLLIHEAHSPFDQSGPVVQSLEETSQTEYQSDFSPGNYRIQVRSRFADGSVSQWTERYLQVTESESIGPEILTPVTGDFITESAHVSWTTDAEATSYDIRATSGDILGLKSTSTIVPTVSANNDIQVRSRYADGTVSQWSAPVSIVATPPPTFTIGNSDFDPLLFFVTLIPANQQRSIRIDLIDVSTNRRINGYESAYSLSTRTLALTVPHPGTYRFEVSYSLRIDNQFYYSRTSGQNFEAQLSFADSIAQVSASASGNTINAEWSHPNAQSYDVTIDYDQDPVYGNTRIETLNAVAGTNGQFRQFNIPVDATRFALTVVAKNASGDSSSSTRYRFDKQDRQPIRLLEGQGVQGTLSPRFRWTKGALDPAVSRYELLLSGDSQAYRQSNIQSESLTVDTNLAAGTYQIYLRAHFVDGTTSSWSETAGIVRIRNVAAPPEILTPSGSISDPRPTLEWQNDEDASHFEVWLSSDQSITPIIHNTTVVGSTLVPDSDLAAGRYRLWVRRHYPDGNMSQWTPTHRFEINDDQVVQITSGTGLQAAGEQEIGWETIPGAVSYEMYVNEVGLRHIAVYRNSDITASPHVINASLEAGKSYEVWMRAHFEGGGRTRWGANPPVLQIAGDLAGAQPTLQINGTTATWSTIQDATRYELWVNEVDPENTNRTIQVRAFWERLEGTSRELPLAPGYYRAWVSALSADGTQSLWSEAVELIIT